VIAGCGISRWDESRRDSLLLRPDDWPHISRKKDRGAWRIVLSGFSSLDPDSLDLAPLALTHVPLKFGRDRLLRELGVLQSASEDPDTRWI
jgi:hypothetical protein